MDITATVDASSFAVRLAATGSTGTVSWVRRYQGTDTAIGTGTSQLDLPPLNVPVEYAATDDLETDVVGPVTVTADGPILSTEGGLLAVPVTVLSYRPVDYINPSRVWPILGRGDPVVTVHPTLYPSGVLRLYAERYDDMAAMLALLPTGRPLLLRSTCEERVPTFTFNYQRATAGYMNDRAVDVPAYIDYEFQQVEVSPGIAGPPPTRTWQTVLDGHATWQTVLDGHATWLEVLEGVPA